MSSRSAPVDVTAAPAEPDNGHGPARSLVLIDKSQRCARSSGRSDTRLSNTNSSPFQCRAPTSAK